MEEWRDIKGYEGLYQVSNEGRVRSLDRENIYESYGKTVVRKVKGKLLIPSKCGRQRDYNFVCLCKDSCRKQQYIHSLVAKAFPEICGEWFEDAEVNHKDENKDNNSATNLEVCTHLHNLTWNDRHIKVGLKERGKISPYQKEVVQFKDGIELCRYPNPKIAGIAVGVNESTIRHNIYGKNKTVKGFTFQYADGSGRLTEEKLKEKRLRQNYLRRKRYEKNKNLAS